MSRVSANSPIDSLLRLARKSSGWNFTTDWRPRHTGAVPTRGEYNIALELMSLNEKKAKKSSDSGAASAKKIRILVADDHPIVCQGLADLINRQSDVTCCGSAASIPQLIRTCCYLICAPERAMTWNPSRCLSRSFPGYAFS